MSFQPKFSQINKFPNCPTDLNFSEDSKLVEDDLGRDSRIIRGEFAKEYLSEKRTILRHIPEKIAGTIIGLD